MDCSSRSINGGDDRRRRRTEKASRLSSSAPVDPVEDSMTEAFSIGTYVEVARFKDDNPYAWHSAKVIETIGSDIYMVEYFEQRNGLGQDLLREIVELKFLRPTPQMFNVREYVVLDSIEAFYNHGWWPGVILSIRESVYTVESIHWEAPKEFSPTELRLGYDWDGENWLPSSQGKFNKPWHLNNAKKVDHSSSTTAHDLIIISQPPVQDASPDKALTKDAGKEERNWLVAPNDKWDLLRNIDFECSKIDVSFPMSTTKHNELSIRRLVQRQSSFFHEEFLENTGSKLKWKAKNSKSCNATNPNPIQGNELPKRLANCECLESNELPPCEEVPVLMRFNKSLSSHAKDDMLGSQFLMLETGVTDRETSTSSNQMTGLPPLKKQKKAVDDKSKEPDNLLGERPRTPTPPGQQGFEINTPVTEERPKYMSPLQSQGSSEQENSPATELSKDTGKVQEKWSSLRKPHVEMMKTKPHVKRPVIRTVPLLADGGQASCRTYEDQVPYEEASYKSGSQEPCLPFVKCSHIWKSLEVMEEFSAMPQKPHFLPLLQYIEGLREGMAIGLMVTFANAVVAIQKLEISDSHALFDATSEMLSQLQGHGFDVGKLKTRLEGQRKLKIRKDELLEKRSSLECLASKELEMTSRLETELKGIENAIANLNQIVSHYTDERESLLKKRSNYSETAKKLQDQMEEMQSLILCAE